MIFFIQLYLLSALAIFLMGSTYVKKGELSMGDLWEVAFFPILNVYAACVLGAVWIWELFEP